MPSRAVWPTAVAIAAAALPADAQLVTQPLAGVEAGIVVLPGVQTQPALSRPFAGFIAYTDQARIPSEVWYCRLNGLACPAFQVPAMGGDQYQPAVAGDLLVYVDEGLVGPRKGNIVRLSLSQGYSSPVSASSSPQARPAVSDQLIAWEDDRDPVTGTDIWIHDNLTGMDRVITGVGVQRLPRVSGTLVSYLDDAAGAVKVYDVAGSTTVAYPAMAVSADLDGAAVAVETLAGGIEVRSITGQVLAKLVVSGLQSNPHISGDWVAFEDRSTPVSRVIIWNWKLGGLFAPPAGTSSQILNDISWPRVVYADNRNQATGQDIFLFDASAAAGGGGGGSGCEPDEDGEDCDRDDDGDDGHGRGGQGGRCAEVAAAPLAELRVTRMRGGPHARNVEFTVAADVPALVCIDASHVSSGWVLLDREAVAHPGDFDPRVTHLERRFSVAAGRNQLGALLAGKPGSWLSVKVFPDPGGGPAPVAGAALRLPAGATVSPQAPPGQGCGSGAAGLAAALPLAGWLRRRRRSGP